MGSAGQKMTSTTAFGDFRSDQVSACQRCIDLIGAGGNKFELHRVMLETILGVLKQLEYTEINLFKSFDLMILFMDKFFEWCQLSNTPARCDAGKELVSVTKTFFGLCIPHHQNISLPEIITFTRSDLCMMKGMSMPDAQVMDESFDRLCGEIRHYANESDHVVSLIHFLMFLSEFNSWVAWLNREHESGPGMTYRNKSIFPRLYHLLSYIAMKM